jgi:hypothetical protein
MKKVITVITGIFLALTLSACSTAELEELEKSLDELSAYSDVCVNGYNSAPCFLKWEWHDIKLHDDYGYMPGRVYEYKVETRDGCPNGIYAEVAVLDKSGYQIDYATEYTTAVRPGQTVILTFSTYNENAYSSDISEVNCR